MVQAAFRRHESTVRHILGALFPGETWQIDRPQAGQRKPSFVARSDRRNVFVKLDVEAATLQRLGDRGIAPPVIAAGTSDGHAWIVQPWLEGVSPNRDWLGEHWRQVAHLLADVHTDQPLLDLVSRSVSIATDLTALRERLATTTGTWFERDQVATALGAFFDDGAALADLPFVPSHDEPNTSNMLVVDDRLYLIDWDDLCLADPLRDLGPLLWWYFPPATWRDVLAVTGLPWNAAMARRIHWFAARASLGIALWHANHGSLDDRGFIGDFIAANASLPNPRS